jgi:hypothetical protein
MQDEGYTTAAALAEQVQALTRQRESQALLLEAINPAPFNSRWLVYIKEALPSDVALAELEITGNRIFLVCTTADTVRAETYRYALLDHFGHARFSRFNRLENGHMHFELIVLP